MNTQQKESDRSPAIGTEADEETTLGKKEEGRKSETSSQWY